ncbi:RagB/SusD family nutrient uptake outer membrane protein [Flavobacterium chuncheonense]|uniref:RagB/SusD family nutrient uptake outer membrane protein n=1 Tax=Flavobacterium chuncheonense TaxID=2026653 RepID=A0ABW5YJZ5_9FLAO
MKTIIITLNKKIALFVLLTSVSILSQSCEDFVAVDLPTNQLTGATVFEDVTTADAAMTHVYSRMRDVVLVTGTSDGLSCLLGNYSDEFDYYSTGGLSAEYFYQNNLLPTTPSITTLWNSTYELIYAVNSVIEGVTTSGGISVADKERLLGEAYFVRAYLHFYLVNLYGEIPYVLTTDYEINTNISKLSIPDVYAAMTTDLQQAVSLMPEAYSSFDRIRPNRSVGYALLSRIKLYSEHWNEALLYADMVLANSALYQMESDLNQVFLNSSTGTLWQLLPQFSGSNTLEAQSFIFSSGPPPSFALTDAFINSFAIGDMRKNLWIGTVTDGSQNWYYPNKYKEQAPTGSSVEYSILFRIEELYLIRAEAKAQLGDLDGAKQDLNLLRNRAGLADTAALTTTALLAAIQDERRFEFFTELGHRWFDLKRTGTATSVLGVLKPGWDSKDLLLPLPSGELLLNPNLLPQNAGY